jgi:stearoyl-CoA desaturase (delta-9 desaturase)
MSGIHRWLNLAGVMLPFLGFVAAVVLLWNTVVDWSDLAVMLLMYVISGYGVTLGFHRLLTHRSFQTFKPVEYTLAILGSVAVQGPVMSWVADHRKHHAHTDKEGDPHSPHGHGGGFKGAVAGLWYAHMGWLFKASGTAEHSRYAKDLYEDPGMRVIHRTFGLWAAVGILIPAGLGFAIDGTLAGAVTAALWGGPVRIFALHHVTWSINSVCHVYGERPFEVRSGDKASNFWPLALISFGESWHNLHHADPTSARHGVLRGQIDTSARVIWLFEKAGAAYEVKWPKPERLAAKRVAQR